MSDLTERQREILKFISDFITGKGYAPTTREISAGLGLKTPVGIHEQLDALEKKGALERPRGADGKALARAMKVKPPPSTEAA